MKSEPDQLPYALAAAEVVERLGSDARLGLTAPEAAERLARHGPNLLPEPRARSVAAAILAQFTNFLMGLLLIATAVSVAIAEYVDAVTIAAIVVLSALLGFIQEWRAERSVALLKRMTAPEANVVRDGVPSAIPARDVVPGDIVMLGAGNYVPADVRLIESRALKIDEASLTGESEHAIKQAAAVSPSGASLADRAGCAFAGTVVTFGRGVGVVTETGSGTEIGRIARLIAAPEKMQTPLQLRISELARYLGAAALTVSFVVFAVGVARGFDLVDIALTAISLAVAAVPEGLPAVVVISLALGVQRMAGRRALVRRLAAVETLGSATVIASDKTGTLTRGEMTVTAIIPGLGSDAIDVTGVGYEPRGQFLHNGRILDGQADRRLSLLLTAGALCNDARLEQRDGDWSAVGDATEAALVVVASKAGIDRRTVEAQQPRIEELPFSPEHARMTTVHETDGGVVAYMKGAPEVVLARCRSRQDGAGQEPLTTSGRQDILLANERLASAGLRVLGLAYRTGARGSLLSDLESEMVFLGLVGMQDPPREEVRDAVAACQKAGIRPLMVTGDHAATAVAIARQIGLQSASDGVLTGAELSSMSDEALRSAVESVSIFARTSAEQKVRIVQALQANGEVVAVTGDGVNDAPALHRADIGVAMGLSGTDVAREAADMVIGDDNFATIVAAVEEGRHIFDNIRNFLVYLLGGNIGEIIVVFVGVISGLPLPLLPIQILFVNLVTDGPPALALGVEPGDPAAQNRPPRPRREQLVTRAIWISVVFRGLILGATVLAIYVLWYEGLGRSEEESRTVAFATLVVAHVLKAFTCRSLYRTAWSLGPLTNLWLVAGCAASLGALLLVLYAPGLSDAFETTTLHVDDWLVIAGFCGIPLAVFEAMKLSPWRLRP